MTAISPLGRIISPVPSNNFRVSLVTLATVIISQSRGTGFLYLISKEPVTPQIVSSLMLIARPIVSSKIAADMPP